MNNVTTAQREKEDREALDEYYKVEGVTKTAREFCNDAGLPYEIFLWRKKNKKILGKLAFKLPEAIVYHDGKAYTIQMISQEIGVSVNALRDRWNHGVRGLDMFKPLRNYEVEDNKAKSRYECREHLKALLRAHKIRAILLLKRADMGDVEEPFDYATALLNAQRLEDAARDHLTRSTGQLWDAA